MQVAHRKATHTNARSWTCRDRVIRQQRRDVRVASLDEKKSLNHGYGMEFLSTHCAENGAANDEVRAGDLALYEVYSRGSKHPCEGGKGGNDAENLHSCGGPQGWEGEGDYKPGAVDL